MGSRVRAIVCAYPIRDGERARAREREREREREVRGRIANRLRQVINKHRTQNGRQSKNTAKSEIGKAGYSKRFTTTPCIMKMTS